MASFRACWNWGVQAGKLKNAFPSRGLKYPKTDEKPPFMTWQEIERKMAPGLTEAQRAELWGCLYLTPPELEKLLQFVRQQAAHGWIYPLVCFAAMTGARRSEMLRPLVSDLDFEAMTVLIREKKRSRQQRTTRRVPLTPFLAGVLRQWLLEHPGGPFRFSHAAEVFRSKKRGRTTGHRGMKTRQTSLRGRLAGVRQRHRPALGPLTRDEVHDHFQRTLAGSRWAVVPGLHCFRHSFISICAGRGVDQRLIDEWVGHQTDEQRRRYRHLLPSTQAEAIRSVFGDGKGDTDTSDTLDTSGKTS
jgi:integrase